MTRIEWNEGLELGVEMIDKQHRHLIGLANKLLAAARAGAGKEMVEAFHGLREYTVLHFNDEEEYMRGIGYPGLNEHSQLHMSLKHQVKHFQDALFKHAEVTEAEILDFMKQWLIDHIIYKDMDVKVFLAAKERGEAAGGAGGRPGR